MTRWLFVASSPRQAGSTPLPQVLAGGGDLVTVVACDDFVVDAVVRGELDDLRDAGVDVLFEDGALARRGLHERVAQDRRCTMDDLAERVLDPATRVVWR